MALSSKIQTYHCLCTSLLLATTHELSKLPRRKPHSPDSTTTTTTDGALILPLPSSPPSLKNKTLSDQSTPNPEDDIKGKGKAAIAAPAEEETETAIPPEGYTILIGLQKDRKTTIIRREDGFEKRFLHRCVRCALVIGYEIPRDDAEDSGHAMDVDRTEEEEKDGGYEGKVIYLLPAGITSTEVMLNGGMVDGGKRRIGEGDVVIDGKSMAVFE